MKVLLLTLVLISAISANDAASLSGKWQVDRSAAGRDSRQECTITQKGNNLTGNCGTERGQVAITGKLDGAKVTWTYRGDSEGGAVTVVYKGTLQSAGKISGTVTAVEFGVEGEFTATQQK